MHWASLWSLGGRLRAQGRGMELQVIEATDVSLKSWREGGTGEVSNLLLLYPCRPWPFWKSLTFQLL